MQLIPAAPQSNSAFGQNMMMASQMRSQRVGGINMSANSVAHSRFTSGAAIPNRSSVVMQASIAL
jgi:hypothetical protein